MKFFLGAGVLIIVGFLVFNSGRVTMPDTAEAGWPVPDVTAVTLDESERLAQSMIIRSDSVVGAGLVPHHLLAAPLLSAFFLGLDQAAPRIVVIIGPDHQDRAASLAVTSRHTWISPDGQTRIHQGLVDTLVSQGLVSVDETLIQHEHGVYTPIPFARRAGISQVVLIALRSDADAPLLERLATVLDQELDQTDMLLAVVDFSHYKNSPGAAEDDALSLPVIRDGQADAALSIPVDSPPSISLLLRFAARRGLRYQQLMHTNSAELTGQPDVPSVTSYLTAYFTHP